MIELSKGSGKMEGLYSINTNPLNNEYCKYMSNIDSNICSKCYSKRMLKSFRKSCVKRFTSNGYALSSSLLMERDIPSINSKVIRINSHGELINDIHWENLKGICNYNRNTLFVLFTKRHELIDNKPYNMKIVYGNPIIDLPTTIVPHECDMVYNVVTKDYALDNGIDINCSGKCKDCMKCYTWNDITTIYSLVK